MTGSNEKLGHLIVWLSKSNRRIELPLEPQCVRDTLSANRWETVSPYVFPTKNALYPERYDELSLEFIRKCRRMKIREVGFHCLRHMYVQEQIAAGRPIWWLKQSIGHGSLGATGHYATSEDRLKRIEQLENELETVRGNGHTQQPTTAT